MVAQHNDDAFITAFENPIIKAADNRVLADRSRAETEYWYLSGALRVTMAEVTLLNERLDLLNEQVAALRERENRKAALTYRDGPRAKSERAEAARIALTDEQKLKVLD